MARRCIVLLGIGHTNAYVVKQWITDPIPNCRLVCISKFPIATYSGMLPGTLAGHFTPEEMQIDLDWLVKKAGAELCLADVTGFDPDNLTLHFANADPLRFDALSVGVGSMPVGLHDLHSASVVPIKPMQTFLNRLNDRLENASSGNSQTLRVAIIGGGVAGLEIALCLHARTEGSLSTSPISIQIFTGGDSIGEGLRPKSVRRLGHLLADRGIEVRTHCYVDHVTDQAIVTRDGNTYCADCVIWATAAIAPPVLSVFGLPTDERGFLATQRTLQTTAKLPVFAVGDSGTIAEDRSPKAGVYAVRQAPVLWHNLHAALEGTPMQRFYPQRNFLKILNTGDGKALLEYKGFTCHARWCMKWKTWIDRQFIKPYRIDSNGRR